MGKQYVDLREHAYKLLNLNKDDESLTKNYVEQVMDELLVYQIELEAQNFHLIETQKELELSHQNYQELYHLAPIGYFTLDAMDLITDVNAVGAALLGINKDQLINRIFSRYIAPESQYIYSEYRNKILKGVIEPCEIKLMKRGGSLFYAKLDCKVMGSETDKKYLVIISDFTQHHARATTEAAAHYVHELNRPLSVISNYVHGCIHRLDKGSIDTNKLLQAMKDAAQQLNHVSELILRMKNFNCRDSLDLQLVCLDSVMNEAISLIKHELYEFPLKLSYRKNKSFTTVMMDKLHIQQVILNLAANSIESLRDAKVEDPKLTIEVNQASNHMLEVCIRDNGPGFPKEIAHQLFNPHFTTKPYGIGLGLAVSRTIVESHGGTLVSDFDYFYGACFKFTLPVSN